MHACGRAAQLVTGVKVCKEIDPARPGGGESRERKGSGVDREGSAESERLAAAASSPRATT